MLPIKTTIRRDGRPKLSDVLTLKNRLRSFGYYTHDDYGSPYPNNELISAVHAFQKDEDLKVDGVVTPKGETSEALSARSGEGYIWRSQKDGKVRSMHRQLDGRIFRWDETPPGGHHPGEAPNCRCVAESIEVIPPLPKKKPQAAINRAVNKRYNIEPLQPVMITMPADPFVWGAWVPFQNYIGMTDDTVINVTVSFANVSNAAGSFDYEIRGGDSLVKGYAVGSMTETVMITGYIATTIYVRLKSHFAPQRIRLAVK